MKCDLHFIILVNCERVNARDALFQLYFLRDLWLWPLIPREIYQRCGQIWAIQFLENPVVYWEMISEILSLLTLHTYQLKILLTKCRFHIEFVRVFSRHHLKLKIAQIYIIIIILLVIIILNTHHYNYNYQCCSFVLTIKEVVMHMIL